MLFGYTYICGTPLFIGVLPVCRHFLTVRFWDKQHTTYKQHTIQHGIIQCSSIEQ